MVRDASTQFMKTKNLLWKTRQNRMTVGALCFEWLCTYYTNTTKNRLKKQKLVGAFENYRMTFVKMPHA